MTPHLGERLVDIVFSGDLSAEERRHLDGCTFCQRELSATEGVMAGIAAVLPAEAPSSALRARVIGMADWERQLAALARFVDLTVDAARAVLARARDGREWEAGPIPNMRLFHFEGGAATVGADVGLVGVPAGAPFPWHDHVGRETVLILSGGYTDHSGRHFGPGDVDDHADGDAHSYVCDPDEEMVLALVLRGSVRFG